MTRTPVQRTQSIADEQLQMSTLPTPILGYDTGQTEPLAPLGISIPITSEAYWFVKTTSSSWPACQTVR